MDNRSAFKQSRVGSQPQLRKARTAKVINAIEKDQHQRRSNEALSIDWTFESNSMLRAGGIDSFSDCDDRLRSSISLSSNSFVKSDSSMITPTLLFWEESTSFSTIDMKMDDEFMKSRKDVATDLFDGLLVCAPNREDFLEKMLEPINDNDVNTTRVSRRKAIISQEEIKLFTNES
jgi:hypothetical protein